MHASRSDLLVYSRVGVEPVFWELFVPQGGFCYFLVGVSTDVSWCTSTSRFAGFVSMCRC